MHQNDGIETSDVVAVARAIERDDPIDWGMLRIDEQDTYELIASSVVLEMEGESRERLLGHITKLLVENTVLSLHLFSMDSAK